MATDFDVRSFPSLSSLRRKHILLYLLDRVKHLTTPEVAELARELDAAGEPGQRRTVEDVWRELSMAKNGRSIKDDPVLDNVVIVLDPSEGDERPPASSPPFATKYSTTGWDSPRSAVETLAGRGPGRPLLKDLYSLASLGMASVSQAPAAQSNGTTQHPKTIDVFVPTSRGKASAEALRIIFEHLDFPDHDSLHLVVGSAGPVVERT